MNYNKGVSIKALFQNRYIKTGDCCGNLFALLVIYIITFPVFEPDYSIGLDASYFWALNFLFDSNYSVLKGLIYPFGPLGFLKNATVEGINLEIALLFYSTFKIWFSYKFINFYRHSDNRLVLSYLILLIILMFVNIDLIIIGIVFIYAFLYVNTFKYKHITLAVLVSFLGFCIKVSIGASSFSIIFMAFVIQQVKNRNLKQSLTFISIALLSILIIGFIVFQNFYLLWSYIVNGLKLSFGYSSALALHPNNNWILILTFFASVLFPTLYIRKEGARNVFLLLLLPLFAMWKHAMVRQDFTHSLVMFNFLFLYWALLIAVSGISTKKLMFLAFVSLTSFHINMQNTWNYKVLSLDINGVSNFRKTLLDFKNFKTNYINISRNNVKPSVLSQDILDIVGKGTIDSYPWELSYFAANKELNWKPRPTLQGGSFARWLDSLTAHDFRDNDAPVFLIFHYVEDRWRGKLGSIDDRYLLNDNPQALYSILNNYFLKLKTDKFLLLERGNREQLRVDSLSKEMDTEWGKWIEIDGETKGITRLKVLAKRNLLGKTANFFYKSEPYYVDYLLNDNRIFSFRYVPENAKDGIWVNPFIRYPNTQFLEQKVVKVRFRCTYPYLNQKRITYRIERINYNDKGCKTSDFNEFFWKREEEKVDTFIYRVEDFEGRVNARTSDLISFSGKKSNEVRARGAFSYTYNLALDSLWKLVPEKLNAVTVETNVKYLTRGSDAKFVVSTTGTSADFWKGRILDATDGCWSGSLQSIVLDRHSHSKGYLEIYVWNLSADDVYIDDMQMLIRN
ncbi:MAG: hypothetical protein JW783_16610 [Bacteroidales bacterium]|nr:hypothetical protein [Bacteroidales bacterium]MBN2750760.1 hypothetical protein [Bacteroidales bacterium]